MASMQTLESLESNRWYELVVAKNTTESLLGTALYNQRGSVYSSKCNTSNPAQQWQIYPLSSNTCILRTRASGPDGYLATGEKNTDTPTATGNTVPILRSSAGSDSSMIWHINAWNSNDNTFFFTNAANGTGMHLMSLDDGTFAMSTNTTIQNAQRFSWNALANINDARFSSIDVWLAPIQRVGN
jgi:hypothetical protein